MEATEVACVALFVPHNCVALFITDCLMSKRGDYSVPFLIYSRACDLGTTNSRILWTETSPFLDYRSDGHFAAGYLFEPVWTEPSWASANDEAEAM